MDTPPHTHTHTPRGLRPLAVPLPLSRNPESATPLKCNKITRQYKIFTKTGIANLESRPVFNSIIPGLAWGRPIHELKNCSLNVYRASACASMQSQILWIGPSNSVRPSLCLSNAGIVSKVFPPLAGPSLFSFFDPTIVTNSKGEPRGLKCMGQEKFRPFMSEMVRDRLIVTIDY